MPDWLQLFLTPPFLEIELRLIGLVLLFLIVRFVLQAISRRLAGRLDKVVTDADRRVRLQTLLRVGRDVAIVIALLAMVAAALQLVGLDVGLVFASAGVIALLVSVSAQTIIRDYLGGILIIAEDHFRVGDVIQVGDKKGRVERVTLRLTYLRGDDGALHLISNGEMRILSNLSRRPN
jgi:small-conductance mechanosensitive channel